MSKPNAVVDKVSSISLQKEIEGTLDAGLHPQVKKVEFRGGRTGLLDANIPRSKVWGEIIESQQKRNMPVYVEINPETNFITDLLLPKEVEVSSLKQTSTGDIEVIFRNTAAIHYLKREKPDFTEMLNALQAAKEKNAPVLVTDNDLDHEIVDVKTVRNSSLSALSATLQPPLILPRLAPTVVSEQRAKELFDLVSSRSCNPATAASPCIPFRYPDDGCWIRAELMCDQMIKESVTPGSTLKVEPEKVWIDGQLYGVKTKNHPNCAISWGWHVAPTLLVTTPNGPQRMVVDPSLFPGGPITPEEWKKVQSDPNAALTYTLRTKYNHWDDTVATEATANNDMEYYRNLLKNRIAKYGPPPYKCCFVDITWPYGHKINILDSTPKALGACTFNNKLHLFWKANDPDNRIFHSASEYGINWPDGRTINNVDSTPEALTACSFNNKLYLFWKANDPGNRIFYSSSTDGINWPNGRTINNVDSTPQALAACTFNNKLYLFWKANDPGNRIFYSASADGINWPNGKTINNVDSTPKALTACVFRGKLYAFWKSNDSGNRIFYSASADGINWPNGGTINKVDSTPETITSCVFNNKLFLFWKANDSGSGIFFSSSSDGISWPAARIINDFDSTPQAPAACVFNNQLYLFWKANDPGNRIYCSMNYAGNSI